MLSADDSQDGALWPAHEASARPASGIAWADAGRQCGIPSWGTRHCGALRPRPFQEPGVCPGRVGSHPGGCDLLTVLLSPPRGTGGAVIESYQVWCVPARCASSEGHGLSGAGSSTPPCTTVVHVQGPGRKLPSGQLQLQLPFPALPEYVAFKCRTAALNEAGWGAVSALKRVWLPPSLPQAVPTILSIAADKKTGAIVVTCRKPPAGSGVTGFLLTAQPSGARSASGGGKGKIQAAVAAGAAVTVQFRLNKHRFNIAPNTRYLFSVQHTRSHSVRGAGRALLSAPATQAFTMPAEEPSPPGAPSIATISALDPLTTPACRDRAGDTFYSAGCDKLTIVVQPPTDPGASAIEEYLVACKPTWCSSGDGGGGFRRRMHSKLDPCTYPHTVRGPGEPMGDGKLKFTMSLTSGYWPQTAHGCNATALNVARPARCRPAHRHPDPADDVLITAVSDDGTVQLTLPAPSGSPYAPCSAVDLSQYPNTLFHFRAQYTTQVDGVTLRGDASKRDFTTAPSPPTITGVEFVVEADGSIRRASVQVAAPPNSNPLAYAIMIDGSQRIAVDTEDVSSGPGGTLLLSVAPGTAFQAGQAYSFAAIAIGSGGESQPSTPAFRATAPAVTP
ncbi:hypothetical protein ABPG75_003798 [Micractinium tetrahymenae]